MIALEMRNLGGGEILHACPQESLDKPLPCIVFYHGFTSSKLVYSYFAVALAEAGFRVIMPDAPEHGARYQGDEAGRMQRFWPILQQNSARRSCRQADLCLAERRPPSHYARGAGYHGRLFSAAPLNADYADALILKLFEDRGIGLFAGDHHVYLSGLAE